MEKISKLQQVEKLEKQIAELRTEQSNTISSFSEQEQKALAEQSKSKAEQVNKQMAELKVERTKRQAEIDSVNAKYKLRINSLKADINVAKSDLSLTARRFLTNSGGRSGKWLREHNGDFTRFNLGYTNPNGELKSVSFSLVDHNEKRAELVKKIVAEFGVSEKSVGSELTNHFANGKMKRDYRVAEKK